MGRGGLGLQLPAGLAPGTADQRTLRPTRHPRRVERLIAGVDPECRRQSPDPLIIPGLQITGLAWALAQLLGALLVEIASRLVPVEAPPSIWPFFAAKDLASASVKLVIMRRKADRPADAGERQRQQARRETRGERIPPTKG